MWFRGSANRAVRRAVVVAAWIWVAAGCAPLTAQTATLRFRHLGTDQGLAQSAVLAILQDRRGFVWLGTQDGLDRYDGADFLHLRHHPENPELPSSLSSNSIAALAEDRSGRLWIGTVTTGLDRYDPVTGELRNFRHQDGRAAGLPGNRIRALALDPGGWIWVATDSGLAHLDPSTGDAIAYRHDPADPASLLDDHLSTLLVDHTGRLWIGTRRGLDCFDPHSGKFLHAGLPGGGLGEVAVRALHQDRRGRLWVGTLTGLDLYDPERGSLRHFAPAPGDPYALSSAPVRTLIEDGYGRLWIGTDQGIHIFDEERGVFEHHRHDRSNPASLSQDVVTTFLRDRAGLLWIGTQGGSANIWDPAGRFFGHVASRPDEPGGLPSDNIQAFAEIGDQLFVGTLGGGLAALDRPSGRFTVFRAGAGADPLADDRVGSLAAGPDGRLWIGTFTGGLQRFDPRTRRFERWRHRQGDESSVASDAIPTLFVDRRGRLWVGHIAAGLDRFDEKTGAFVHYRFAENDPASLPSDAITALAERPAGGLFVGTRGGGLAFLDADDRRVVRLSAAPGDLQGLDSVYALYADPKGSLWVATADAGLVQVERFDPATGKATIRRFADAENAPVGTVWGIQPDASGRLWLSTNRGLAQFDPAQRAFRSFPTRYGLQGDEFNYGAHFRSSRGELFFGGNHGYNAFFPEQLPLASEPPAVVITQVAKRGALLRPELLAGDPPLLELDHHDSVLTVDFAALDFAAPEEHRYRYRLEGFDEGWSAPARSRSATFTNLDPGSYTLRVIAANADGVWSQRAASLALRVLPAPWETWWAILFYLVAGAGLIGSGIRWRLGGLERSRRELQLLVDQRTGELSRTVEQLRLSEQSALDAKMRALRALEDALEERRKAQEASRAKSTFLSNISHELRTPLNAVLGFAQLMERDEELRGEQRQNLEVILRSGEHLLGLINDVLSFAKIEAGRLTLTEAPFELRRLVRDVEEMMRVRADAKGLKLEVEVESALPSVLGDEGRLTQVLLNLLGNAVKFTAAGGVRLVVAWREERASFSVIDTGCGIAEAELAQLFQPFVQARGGRHQGEGTGLGLAICHKLVSLMGGELEVRSQQGQGSTFHFTIPLPASSPTAASPRRGRVVGLAPGQPAPRILVADDAAENRDLLLRLLEPLGIEVRAVADGQAAVETWSAWRPHLVLMDIRMPVLDGYGAIRHIRQAEAEAGGRRTAILAITATAFDHDRRRMLAAGCDEVLTKPFRSQALFELLAEQLDLRFLYAEDPSGRQTSLATEVTADPAAESTPNAAPGAKPAPAATPAAKPAATPAAKPAAKPGKADAEAPAKANEKPAATAPEPREGPPAASAGRPRTSPPAASPIDGRRILVVDDNDANRLVAQRALERLGCRVDLAGDGIEALEAASVARYDLIFMDVQMPRLDGIGATRRLRAEPGPSQDCPVVALTGMPTPDEYRRCLSAGMSDLLSKPFRLDDLRIQVERWSLDPASRPVSTTVAAVGPGAAPTAAPAAAPSTSRTTAPALEAPARAPAPLGAPPESGEHRALEDTREVYVAEIIKLFLETAPFQLEALRMAAAGFDLERLAHLAATLGGSSQNFSATALAAACQRLQSLCAAGGDRAQVTAAIDELAHELQRTIQQLRQLQARSLAASSPARR